MPSKSFVNYTGCPTKKFMSLMKFQHLKQFSLKSYRGKVNLDVGMSNKKVWFSISEVKRKGLRKHFS